MTKIVKIADGAFFVPSYSEQTIIRAYTTETTIQSFHYGENVTDEQERKKAEEKQEKLPLFG
jgi:hypothetical protein